MITRHNYEDLFLLYVDNELSPVERQSVETFVKENPDLKEEMETLQQCRLIPEDEVSFGSLEPLLKEKDRDRFIVPFRFSSMTRVAAAAILLLLTGLGVFIAMKKNNAIPVAGIINPGVAIKNDHARVTSATPRTLYPMTIGKQQTMAKEYEQIQHKTRKADHAPMPRNDNPALANDHTPARDDQAADQALTATKRRVQPEVALIDPVHTSLPEKIFVEENNPGRSAPFVTQAVQHDATSPGDDFSEPVPAEKNKLRGIFRKVSRVFDKTANREEDDSHAILVGNLQIALK
jgi:hypothetical protein